MPFPFDLDIPIFLYTIGYTLFQAIPLLRQAQKPIPMVVEFQELQLAALTSAQTRFLAPWDTRLEAMNYRPLCTYRPNYGHALLRTYTSSGDKALCTVIIVEVKGDQGKEWVGHSCMFEFATDFADGRMLITRNMKLKTLMDQPLERLVQECPTVDSPTQLKQKHDLRAASLGEALWPPADAKTLFEHSCRTRDTFNKYQVERGIFKLMPIGDAYTPTDKMHWRAVRSHYNLFGRPPSLALLIPAVLAGAGLPLVSLLKVAPAAVRATADYGLSPDLPVAQITNLVAYLSAGAIIGYLLDHNTLVWTFLLTYIAAHAVLGWTFGIVPYSIIAGMASYYAGQAKKRRRLILIEARG